MKSQNRLAKDLALDRSYIIRAEKGLYTLPSDTLIRYASASLGISVSTVIDRYKSYQTSIRENTLSAKFENLIPLHVTISNPLNPIGDPNANETPGQVFKAWRELYWNTVTNFCNDMCVHPTSVSGFETGSISRMPRQLFDVLNEYDLLDCQYSNLLKESNSIAQR